MGITWWSFDTVLSYVCMPHVVRTAKFMKHVNSWMYLWTLNVIFIFLLFFCLFSFTESFVYWLLTTLFDSPPLLVFSPLPPCICPSSSAFPFSVLLLPCCPSSPLITLTFGRGRRKLVDCPQLLDVDDMVKMREPDWKCVYTYLQEFYRGLVTKGLVKTKNSS